jgi:peptidase E
VFAGLSAGSLCWFDSGVSDSFGPQLAPVRALGWLAGSHCPHYDGEAARRPAYHALVLSGELAAGYAADDGAALHFIGRKLYRVVSSRPDAKAYRVSRSGGTVLEQSLETEFLGAARKRGRAGRPR